jgi:hypothetical protein
MTLKTRSTPSDVAIVRCSARNEAKELLVQDEDHISKSKPSQEQLTLPECHESPASLILTVELEDPELEYGGNEIALELVAEIRKHGQELSIAETSLAKTEDLHRFWAGVESKCVRRTQHECGKFATTRHRNAYDNMNRARISVYRLQQQIIGLQTALMQIKEEQEGTSVEG